MADATSLEKKYVYQISRSGVFLGVLQNIKSEFTFQQDINSAGASLTIEVGDSPDRQFEATEQILTEEGLPLTDELGQPLLIERQPDIVGNLNSKALIRNNNDITVYEISPDYPNGKAVYAGWISRWKASFGGSDSIIINCLSNGTELDNYLILGSQTLDQSQALMGSTETIFQAFSDKGGSSYNKAGQTFQVGAGTNLAAILLSFEGTSTSVDVTVSVYNNSGEADAGTTPLTTVTKGVTGTVGVAKDELFTFPTAISVNIGQTYFYAVTVGTNQSILIDYKNSNVYANGDMYLGYFSGGSGAVPYTITPAADVLTNSDLYFKTYYTAGATSSPYTSQDPTAILRSIIDSYVARGGTINYGTGTTVLAGTSRSYTFKVNTILEGVKKCLELAPYDWYWYIDPGTNTIYFKETSTTADLTMIYGRHIQQLDVQASAEEVKTQAYFTGGDTGSNVYLYQSLAASATILANNAGRVGMQRLSDNRVILSDTATALMTNYLNGHNAENYQSSITVNAQTYDITLFKPGLVIGFAGFGNFVDNLLLQIVHIEYHAEYITMGLGVLPKRASAQVEEIDRALNDVQTIYNPSSPS